MSSELNRQVYKTGPEKQEEFLLLLNPVYTQLERYCLAVERDRERAYDLIGETILRAYENFGRLRDEKAFLSWLFTTASRLQQRWSLRRRLFGDYDEHLAAKLHADIPQPDASADTDILYEALAKLPRKEREAVVLFEINDLTLKEILAIQGGSLSALKVRLHRGRKRLARLLGVEEESLPETDSEPNSERNNGVMILP